MGMTIPVRLLTVRVRKGLINSIIICSWVALGLMGKEVFYFIFFLKTYYLIKEACPQLDILSSHPAKNVFPKEHSSSVVLVPVADVKMPAKATESSSLLMGGVLSTHMIFG